MVLLLYGIAPGVGHFCFNGNRYVVQEISSHCSGYCITGSGNDETNIHIVKPVGITVSPTQILLLMRFYLKEDIVFPKTKTTSPAQRIQKVLEQEFDKPVSVGTVNFDGPYVKVFFKFKDESSMAYLTCTLEEYIEYFYG